MKRLLVLLILFTSQNIFTQSSHWKEDNPFDFAYKPYVKFINDSIGWVMTGGSGSQNNNAIFKTTNGGNSWFCASSFVNANLQVFQQPFVFTDPDTGYYFLKNYDSGYYFRVYKTTDGGINWSNIYSLSYDGFIWDHWFINGSKGWIISDRYTPNYSQELIKTIDGGVTWTVKSVLPYTANTTKLVYLDDDQGIILYTNFQGSTIIKTSDGGATWFNVLSINEIINSIKFINENIGYAAFGGKLYKTTNGGSSWIQFNLIGSNIDLVDVFEDSIIVASGNTGGVIISNTQVFLSTNSGVSWVTMTSSGFENRVYSISIINPNLIFLGLYKNVVKSIGFNSNWERIPIGPTYNLTGILNVEGGKPIAIGWKNDSISGDYKSAIITSPPLWRTKSVYSSQKFACLYEKDNADIFIGGYDYSGNGQSIIYKCDNQGDSLVLKYSGTGFIINSICFVDDIDGFAVGDAGMILRTNDGGNNWSQSSTITTEDLYAILFYDQLGFICGTNGFFLRSENGGITWAQLNLNTSKKINSIFFQDENNIFIVGDDGLIFKSSNRGISWYDISYPDLYNLKYVTARDCINIGIYGEKKTDHSAFILETHDGGSSWGFGNINYLKTINSAYVDINYKAWAVGDYGTIIYSNAWNTPVELIVFTASINQSKVQLNWQTATELNNQGFEIQRKIENSDWITIGFRQGRGTTTEPTSYFYEDDISEVNSNKIYYRLKQIDFNGTFNYSDEVEILTHPLDFELYQNFPNPFNPSTIIKYEVPKYTNVKLEIFDVLGRNVNTLINEEKPAGRYEVEFNSSSLASGVYYYRIQAGDFVATKKMLLLK